MTHALLALLTLTATDAKPTERPRPHAARAFIPDDADPCDFERFKADAGLASWMRQTSPNTATAAHCYHTSAKLLSIVSRTLDEVEAKALKLDQGAPVKLAAAALTGYQVDSIIEVVKDGRRSVALVLKSGTNGPTLSQIYVAP